MNARNEITVTAALAVQVLRYRFGIMNWRLEELRKIERKAGKVLIVYKMHHPAADINRLYVTRKPKEGCIIR